MPFQINLLFMESIKNAGTQAIIKTKIIDISFLLKLVFNKLQIGNRNNTMAIIPPSASIDKNVLWTAVGNCFSKKVAVPHPAPNIGLVLNNLNAFCQSIILSDPPEYEVINNLINVFFGSIKNNPITTTRDDKLTIDSLNKNVDKS